MNAQLKPVELDDNLPIVGTAKDLMFNPVAMQAMTALAKVMATSTVTVPKHLQGKEGDCLAIVMQAVQWGLNPFVVAQKTHVVNGVLGYEAQLVQAVIMSSGAIIGTFKYEYKGDGMTLECRVGAILKGDAAITWNEWLSIKTITTKNSPLWTTNPKQQMGYLQVKNWARAFCPGAILGVYSVDELETIGPREIVINPTDADLPIPIETLLEQINTMEADQLTPDALKSMDIKPYTDAERAAIKNAITQRRKALKEASVVADQPKQTEAEGSSDDGDGQTDWQQMLNDAASQDEVKSIYDAMPNDLKAKFNDLVDVRMDALRG